MKNRFLNIVPEPSSLALLGVGRLGNSPASLWSESHTCRAIVWLPLPFPLLGPGHSPPRTRRGGRGRTIILARYRARPSVAGMGVSATTEVNRPTALRGSKNRRRLDQLLSVPILINCKRWSQPLKMRHQNDDALPSRASPVAMARFRDTGGRVLCAHDKLLRSKPPTRLWWIMKSHKHQTPYFFSYFFSSCQLLIVWRGFD